MVTLPEFCAMLLAHDWYYSYSDDQSVWRAGRDSETALNACTGRGDAYDVIYEVALRARAEGQTLTAAMLEAAMAKAPKPNMDHIYAQLSKSLCYKNGSEYRFYKPDGKPMLTIKTESSGVLDVRATNIHRQFEYWTDLVEWLATL